VSAEVSPRLENITFNHDPTSATTDALNIRMNATQFLPVPEWQRGVSVGPEDSLAAYAIQEVQGNQLTMQARFSWTGPNPQTVEIRAIRTHLAEPPPWWLILATLASLPGPASYYLAIYLAYYNQWYASVAGPPRSPGATAAVEEVRGKAVSFQPGGESGSETFEIENPLWLTGGVGVHDLTWRWQFRRQSSDPWQEFDRSYHRIYTLLDMPRLPWEQLPFDATNGQLPWSEVLDIACQWSRGARSTDEAAARATRAVFALGPSLLEYGCPIFSPTQYATPWPFFNLTAFLERLHGGLGRGRYVNCTDCATILSTFSNVLGCDLHQARMFGALPFVLNPIRAIGTGTWLRACGWGAFNYHEVAWKGAASANDEVYDACCEVDGDFNPTAPPQRPLLPINMRFGAEGDRQYRDRLAAPGSRQHCRPQPSTRLRRQVY
jgi:hypothetical protein